MTDPRQLVAVLDKLERRFRKDIAEARAWLIHASSGQGRPISSGGDGEADDRAMFTLLLDYEAVADELSCSPRTVRRLISSGALPAVSVGGNCRRVRRQDLESFVANLGGASTRTLKLDHLEDR